MILAARLRISAARPVTVRSKEDYAKAKNVSLRLRARILKPTTPNILIFCEPCVHCRKSKRCLSVRVSDMIICFRIRTIHFSESLLLIMSAVSLKLRPSIALPQFSIKWVNPILKHILNFQKDILNTAKMRARSSILCRILCHRIPAVLSRMRWSLRCF